MATGCSCCWAPTRRRPAMTRTKPVLATDRNWSPSCGIMEDLRSDRDAWREQARRSDYLLGSATERTRKLEGRLRELEAAEPRSDRTGQEVPQDAPTEARGSDERGEAGGGGGDVPPEPQAATSRPWYRRWFG